MGEVSDGKRLTEKREIKVCVRLSSAMLSAYTLVCKGMTASLGMRAA